MSVLRHWLATSPRYSVDPLDARVLPTEDEAEQHREAGWRVDGPYVEAAAYRGAVDLLRKIVDTAPGYTARTGSPWALDHAMDEARDWLASLGGQYEQPATKDTTAVDALKRIRDHANSADDPAMIAQQALDQLGER